MDELLVAIVRIIAAILWHGDIEWPASTGKVAAGVAICGVGALIVGCVAMVAQQPAREILSGISIALAVVGVLVIIASNFRQD